MKKVILFFCLGIFFLPKTNFACSCMMPTSFCEGLLDGFGDVYADLVIRAEVTSNISGGKEISIDEVLYGNYNENKLNFNYEMCTIFFDLEVGKEYVIALNEYAGNYYPLGCRIYYLEIVNEIIVGAVAPGIVSMAYEDFVLFDGCKGRTNVSVPEVDISAVLENDITVFPSPTLSDVKIKNAHTSTHIKNLELKIYDSIGKLIQVIFRPEGILPEEVWTINIQDFSAGLYFINLSSENHGSSFKVVKQ